MNHAQRCIDGRSAALDHLAEARNHLGAAMDKFMQADDSQAAMNAERMARKIDLLISSITG